jgi:hypothetical protein
MVLRDAPPDRAEGRADGLSAESRGARGRPHDRADTSTDDPRVPGRDRAARPDPTTPGVRPRRWPGRAHGATERAPVQARKSPFHALAPSTDAVATRVPRVISADRFEDIARFHSLLQTAVAEGAEPLSQLQRQVWVGMVGELIEHVRATVHN